jgi:hypothetical protein
MVLMECLFLLKSERYAAWQEASRTDIERAFGVLQRKFQILVKKFEYWYVHDIQNIIETCIILHNMMVQNRIEKDEEEDDCWYLGDLLSRDETNDLPVEDPIEEDETDDLSAEDPVEEAIRRRAAENELLRRLEANFYLGPAIRANDRRQPIISTERMEAAQERWSSLYDRSAHFRL